MKRHTPLLTIAIVLGVFLALQVLPAEEVVAWGLPEGFNPRTGKIEKKADVYRAREFIGTTALSKTGEPLGTVEDIIFSDNGRIKYLVLARRGVAEGAERMVPIPWKAASPEVKDHRLVLDVNANTFENAPSFARNDWRRLADPQWEKAVNSYY